jgi:hypothetical protein
MNDRKAGRGQAHSMSHGLFSSQQLQIIRNLKIRHRRVNASGIGAGS